MFLCKELISLHQTEENVQVLVFAFPINILLAKVMLTQRKKGVVLTDQRVRSSTEVLSGIRLIKYYAWEQFFGHQVGLVREREVSTIRKLAYVSPYHLTSIFVTHMTLLLVPRGRLSLDSSPSFLSSARSCPS